ncbi:UvrD-helicase domain-containing protein [Nocardioides massiliensis]|uniref:UvrD-helicase domain-containing protein n=1 Tax=Nocardioides massiliensis TaxID=1325935 RepID=UPI0015EC4D40|nr:UvrD-helicase domain-containing protein [Nocardioides massiliensis]
MTPFAVTGPLPPEGGTTLLEASAGTGKTWTIGALVARYVAEGVATLDEMLVVTFGRAASQELRDRVREQLVELDRALAGELPDEPSDLLRLLVDVDQPERARRRARVRAALGGFDAATIVTTHQFCQLVLRGLGIAGDTDPEARLVEDLSELRGEVVDDLYLRLHAGQDVPQLTYDEAVVLGREATEDPQAVLEPTDAPAESPAGVRVAFAEAVRAELERRKRRLGVLSYDDLLSQLADALDAADSPARVRMRQRWSIVLVDEFQDTDPVQWQVLDRAFTGHATMVLIGDPKQAIYAFRGGDVTTYLQATTTVARHQTLATNWRSDPDLVRGLDVVLRGAALGDERITVREVSSARGHARISGAGAPLRLRAVRPGAVRRGKGEADRVRAHVVDDLVRDVAALLASDARVDDRPVRPADIAVLARTNAALQAIHEALAVRGIPAVVAGGGSVFATPAGAEWLSLLEALEQPHRSVRVRAAAPTAFVGATPAEIDAGGDELTDRIAGRLRGWADLLAGRGVAAVMEAAAADGLTQRVLARPGGERHLTDLRHLAEVLHGVGVEEGLGLVALLGWLREQRADDRLEVAAERTRRLDSDSAAVQLATIHGSKGLEYPIVYLPQLWDRWVGTPPVPRFHTADGRRARDVGGKVAGNARRADHEAAHAREESAESLRLLYVALTRARSQVVAWWAPTWGNTAASPLHRMLFGRLPGWAQVPDEQPLGDEHAIARALDGWQAAGGFAWEWADPVDPPPLVPEQSVPTLAVRRFDRGVDVRWRRTSYSALSAVVDHTTPGVGSEPETTPRTDEPDEPQPAPTEAEADAPRATRSPMADLPVGATFGSLVHAVLEVADPDAADLETELHTHLDEQLVQWPVDVDRQLMVAALLAVMTSPLGPLAPGLTLRDIGLRDRLRELDFELPLAGGDGPRGRVTTSPVRLGDLAPLLRAHLPADDPVLPYAEQLADPLLAEQELRGYLTGSVDVVMRVPGPDDAPRFLVVDYKTNWLGGRPAEPGRPAQLHAEDYRPSALAAAMGGSDYPLQALLYAVVLHRYLRWRLRGYDPQTHLGGVLYLYLRGMCGPETPVLDGGPCGVFSWQPPVALVRAVSDLLDGHAPEALHE